MLKTLLLRPASRPVPFAHMWVAHTHSAPPPAGRSFLEIEPLISHFICIIQLPMAWISVPQRNASGERPKRKYRVERQALAVGIEKICLERHGAGTTPVRSGTREGVRLSRPKMPYSLKASTRRKIFFIRTWMANLLGVFTCVPERMVRGWIGQKQERRKLESWWNQRNVGRTWWKRSSGVE